MGSNHRLMTRWSATTRIWNLFCGPCAPRTPTRGLLNSCGLSTPIMLWLTHQAFLRFQATFDRGSKKLQSCYVGPFPITKINLVAVRLDIPSILSIHPVFHVSKLKPARDSPLQPAPASPSTPQHVDGGSDYTVRELLASRGWLRYSISGL